MPLIGEQLVDVLRCFDSLFPVAEQAIDVPKIFVDDIPPRTSVREPQLAEQLVEVPTISEQTWVESEEKRERETCEERERQTCEKRETERQTRKEREIQRTCIHCIFLLDVLLFE